MAIKEIDPFEEDLKAGLVNSEKELGDNLWTEEDDKPLDEMDDHLGEDTEGDEPDEADAEDEGDEEAETQEELAGKTEVEAKPDAKAKEPTQQEGRIPSSRLKAEADARRAADERATQAEARAAEVEKAAKAEIAAINAKLDGVLAGLNRPAPQPVKPQEKAKAPDMFSDPEGYQAWVDANMEARLQTITQQQHERLLNASLADAHEQHGKQFEDAYNELTRNPNDPVIRLAAQRIMGAPNPGRELMKWHGQQRTLAEVGSDPAAFRTKIETEARAKFLQDPEVRKQIFEDMRKEAAGNGNNNTRSITRLPKSLNGAAGGKSPQFSSAQEYPSTDHEIAAGLFDDR